MFVEIGGKKDLILRTPQSVFPWRVYLFSSFHLSPYPSYVDVTQPAPKALFQNVFFLGLAFSFACSYLALTFQFPLHYPQHHLSPQPLHLQPWNYLCFFLDSPSFLPKSAHPNSTGSINFIHCLPVSPSVPTGD